MNLSEICQTDSTLTRKCKTVSNWVLSIICHACYKFPKVCFLYTFYRPNEKTARIRCFAPASPFYYIYTDGLSIFSFWSNLKIYGYIYNNIPKYNQDPFPSY